MVKKITTWKEQQLSNTSATRTRHLNVVGRTIKKGKFETFAYCLCNSILSGEILCMVLLSLFA